MRQVIVVEAKGKQITGTIEELELVDVASTEVIDNNIATGVDELVAMLSGTLVDPTKKRCSRCVKMGRMPYHHIDDFSLLKTGKRHSQCKISRTEQSAVWCNQRAEHRKAYHKQYQQTRGKRVPVNKAIKALMEGSEAPQNPQKSTENALFIAKL
jgi:hypothetical protein